MSEAGYIELSVINWRSALPPTPVPAGRIATRPPWP